MLRKLVFSSIVFAALLRVEAADAPAPVAIDSAAQSITLPDRFRASLFAGEPNVVQPIAMTTDGRGRLWVVECLSYPNWTTNKYGGDRVSIFEDANGDGQFDKKTVFWDKGRNLTGIALGFGGVWLCSLPELIFVPDADHDDKPDGEPEVMLDGWDMRSQHNAFNGITWGPDGWLYGCNGILGNGLVGRPGTEQKDRTPMNCGVWRFHPVKKVFEVVAHGTTNPWGIAFNETGQMFVANCVIKHLFHIIPGGRYERMFGQDFNPYSFQLIPSIADHIHWAGGYWKTEGAGGEKNETAGGGHAHSGAMIYLGDNWPEKYRNTFFTINIHGHRLNNDLLTPAGSGYVGQHAPDFMRVNDTWFRGVAVVPGHDGAAYVADWSDAGECHDYEDIHRENGRIFKVSYGDRVSFGIDLRAARDEDLVANLSERNEWLVTQSRLVLQERALAGKLNPTTRLAILRLLLDRGPAEKPEELSRRRLRALWALQACGGIPESRYFSLLGDTDPNIRAWTVQLALEDKNPSAELVNRLGDLAEREESPVVRLYLASALQRMPLESRTKVALGLVRHGEDARDHNIPLILWYGIEPVASGNETASIELLRNSKIPLVSRFIAQRLALRGALNGLTELLQESKSPERAADVVHGMFAALNGRRDLKSPEEWSRAVAAVRSHSDAGVRDEMNKISLIFGDASVLEDLRKTAQDNNLPAEQRVKAIEALVQTRNASFIPLLRDALNDAAIRSAAIKGLATFDHPEIPEWLISKFGEFNAEEKAAAVSTLSSRPASALALLEAVKTGKIPRQAITPFAARQIMAYKDPRFTGYAAELGAFRGVSREKANVISKYKEILTPALLEKADLKNGREVFLRTCAGCHTLFGEGGKLAPELTGSQRSNLDYILENVVDPNAMVWDIYKASYFETSDDRLITGVVLAENESTVSIQTPSEVITLPRSDITSRQKSDISLMPEGLFDSLEKQDLIDLVGYLQTPAPPQK